MKSDFLLSVQWAFPLTKCLIFVMEDIKYMELKQYVSRTSTAGEILLLLVSVQICICWAVTSCSLEVDTSQMENILP